MTLSGFVPKLSGTTEPRDLVSEDRRIVEAVKAGDEAAFGQLYRKFAPLVHGILLSRMPAEDVPDLVQEVFLAAFKGIGSLREPDAVGGWLVRMARNYAAGYYRSRRPAEELPEDVAGQHTPHAEATEAMLAIRSLPDAYSETLILRLVEGMTGDEIAQLTGLSPGSVRVNLHRGMDMLRKKLEIR
jgi:RNA polymerase sigma-70 factor (ECF subfamily)